MQAPMGHTATPQSDFKSQAYAFGKYIIKKTPVQSAIDLYLVAMQKAQPLTSRDEKLLKFMLAHPWSIGCIDGALVFIDPHAELRRRLYLMFAILEATPEYSRYFLPRKRSPLYLVVIGLVGIRAVVRAVAGMVIVKVVR